MPSALAGKATGSHEMAISLQDLRTTRADKPPRVLIYGPPKIGKTTLAAEFPLPVFLKVEDGDTHGVDLTGWEIRSFGEAMEAIVALYDDHNFKTVVVDSLSRFEPMVWESVCFDHKWKDMEAPGFGKGYVAADLKWLEFMQAINGLRRKRNMTVVLIAHSEVKRIEDPITGPLDRYMIQLHKRALDIVHKEVDVIAFMNYQISIVETRGQFNRTHRKGVGAGERVLHFVDRPGFMAGNRYGMENELIFRPGEGFNAMSQYLPRTSAPATEREAA
jgi:hypothetical protein